MAQIPNAISPQQILATIGTPFAPLLIDVRREEAWREAATMIPAALRRPPAGLEEWSRPLDSGRRIVVYCRLGHEVSQSAAAALRASGRRAVFLSGGIEGYAALGGPLMRRDALPDRDWLAPTRWVTREKPKIDRIACPWLIARFVDPEAEFLYVPNQEVLRAAKEKEAVPYDVPDVHFSHDGELCSFDTFLKTYRLAGDPALAQLAVIVRGADTARLDLAPQAAGLLAVSLGLSRNFKDDHEMLKHGMVVYDALYAWCREGQEETHTWNPAAYR